jgi:hypothetical protein
VRGQQIAFDPVSDESGLARGAVAATDATRSVWQLGALVWDLDTGSGLLQAARLFPLRGPVQQAA